MFDNFDGFVIHLFWISMAKARHQIRPHEVARSAFCSFVSGDLWICVNFGKLFMEFNRCLLFFVNFGHLFLCVFVVVGLFVICCSCGV